MLCALGGLGDQGLLDTQHATNYAATTERNPARYSRGLSSSSRRGLFGDRTMSRRRDRLQPAHEPPQPLDHRLRSRARRRKSAPNTATDRRTPTPGSSATRCSRMRRSASVIESMRRVHAHEVVERAVRRRHVAGHVRARSAPRRWPGASHRGARDARRRNARPTSSAASAACCETAGGQIRIVSWILLTAS